MKDLIQKLIQKNDDPDITENLGKPGRDSNIGRLSRVPIVIASVIALLFAGCMVYTFSEKSHAQNPTHSVNQYGSRPNRPEDTDHIAFLDNKPKVGSIEPTAASSDSQLTAQNTSNGQLPDQSNASSNTPMMTQSNGQLSPVDEMRLQQMQQHQQELQQARDAKRNALVQALQAETTVYRNNPVSQQNAAERPSDSKKTAFSVDSEKVDTESYLPNTRVHAVSQYEVKAGTVIPSVLIGGINSELPGLIKAQVSQNVFDSATGEWLLIPQGAQLVGSYNNQVQNGQRRVLVVWNRIIYPDSSSINIQGMTGADQSGYSGLHDKVNTHFWMTARNALLLSAITAGVQLSQPRPSNGDYGYSSQQILASSLGMQMNQVGMNILSQNINRSPTLTIRPGFLLNVMVSKDMILPPWNGHFLTQENR